MFVFTKQQMTAAGLALFLIVLLAGCKKKPPPPPPPPPPAPTKQVETAKPAPPTIVQFTAEPTSIHRGQSKTF